MLSSPKSKLSNLLFPAFCIGCGRPQSLVCEKCAGRYLPRFPAQQCHVCGVESRSGIMHKDCREYSSLDGVIIASFYSDLAAKLMHKLKISSQRQITEVLAKVINQRCLVDRNGLSGLATYVPTSQKKKMIRGFNQAQLICDQICKINPMFTEVRLLKRSSQLGTQVGKGVGERAQNVIGQFELVDDVDIPSSVMIIDDVMTTGATLEQCAKVLKRGGVETVVGVVFARNPDFASDNMV